MDSCMFELYDDSAVLCVGSLKKSKYISVRELRRKNFSGQTNIFFTPNALGNRHGHYWRSRKHLQTFEALYCDIDLEPYVDPEAAIEHIKDHAIAGEEVPYPTQINVSGHGLHLFWKINSIDYTGNIEKWKAMQQYIYECFRSEGADPRVTKDTVRLLRMPGTLNVKDSGTTKAYMYEYSGCTYDLDMLIAEYGIKYKSYGPKKDGNKAHTSSQKQYNPKRDESGKVIPFYVFLYEKRVRDLETLLLQHRDYDSSGRENILFLYRYYLLQITGDKKKALDGTLTLNSYLKHPLSDKEVESATRSAEKYYDGTQLNWTNAKIIEFLGISDEEMCDMVTLISNAEKRRRKQLRNKKNYAALLCKKGKITKKSAIEKRRAQIYELRLQGKNRKEICQLLQIGQTTYYSDLKVIDSEIWLASYAKNKEKELEEERSTGTDGSMFANFGNFSSYNYVGAVRVCASDSVTSRCSSLFVRGAPS